MKFVVIVARILLGALMVFSGLNKFFAFVELPGFGPSGDDFLGMLATSGFMDAVAVLEIAGGALLLTGFFVPLGMVLLAPVIVVIQLFHIYFVGQPDPMAIGTAVLGVLVIGGYWFNFKRLLRPTQPAELE